MNGMTVAAVAAAMMVAGLAAYVLLLWQRLQAASRVVRVAAPETAAAPREVVVTSLN